MLQAVDGTSTDLSGLSEWNYHLDIMRALARKKAPVYFYVAVPKKRADLTYPDSMFDLPNVKLLPYEYRGTFLMADEWLKWLNTGTNLVPFDVVWNDCWWFNVTVAVGLIR
ncbi:MAG: hypothetical protein HY681_04300, partial [Chloroflexi bacterium]|nr:hypothetical protein [Chloroflexota bacterium]